MTRTTRIHHGNISHSAIAATNPNQFNYCGTCKGWYQPDSRPQSPKQAAYLFFLRHGACSYDPARETRRQGYARQARRLAKAERDARALGYSFEWTGDWSVGDHEKEFGECYANGGPETCELCLMRDEAGKVVQSLGCVDDATREYRRVVEAELALEQLG